MNITPRTRLLIGYIGVGIAAALIAAGIVWGIMANRLDESRLREEQASLRTTTLEAQVGSLTAQVAALKAASGADASSANEPTPQDAEAQEETSDDEATTPTSERQFCYVREVSNESGTTHITVDYAQMLSGAEAAAAAAAAGEESPPPNDYFIVNQNPMLRTFPVRAGINVRLSTMADGVNPTGYTVVLGQWHDMFVGMSPGMERVRDVPYWITLESGTVTAIEEQYLP